MVEERQSKHNDDWPPVREQFNYYKEIISALKSIEDGKDIDTIRKVPILGDVNIRSILG